MIEANNAFLWEKAAIYYEYYNGMQLCKHFP